MEELKPESVFQEEKILVSTVKIFKDSFVYIFKTED